MIERGTLLKLLERNLLVSWPSNAVVVQQLEAEDDEEWYDFGERYE